MNAQKKRCVFLFICFYIPILNILCINKYDDTFQTERFSFVPFFIVKILYIGTIHKIRAKNCTSLSLGLTLKKKNKKK